MLCTQSNEAHEKEIRKKKKERGLLIMSSELPVVSLKEFMSHVSHLVSMAEIKIKSKQGI